MREYYIYKHTNKINGKCYIGQTYDIKKRWHSSCYKHCEKFYNAIKKYGWNNFTHEILIKCDENNVDYWESYYISKYDSMNNGYNLNSGGNKYKIFSEETKLKISKANKGKKRSAEDIEKNRIGHIGIIHTEETKEKLRQANLGKHHTEEAKEKNRQAHLGKKASFETREKCRQSHLKNPVTQKQIEQLYQASMKTRKKVKNVETGEIFNSITEASKKHNVCDGSISQVCKGKRKTAGKYHWEYVD